MFLYALLTALTLLSLWQLVDFSSLSVELWKCLSRYWFGVYRLLSYSSNLRCKGTEYPSCISFSFILKGSTLSSFFPCLSFRDAQKVWPNQHGFLHISWYKALIFPQDEKARLIPNLAEVGRWSVQWSISCLVGRDRHSLYSKHPHTQGWTFDFNCC